MEKGTKAMNDKYDSVDDIFKECKTIADEKIIKAWTLCCTPAPHGSIPCYDCPCWNNDEQECEGIDYTATFDLINCLIVNNIMESQRIKEVAKAEAYKEFAQKIKQEIKEAYDSNIEVLNEHFEKHRGCFNDTFVGNIEGKNNTLLGLSDFIDNLLEELVGGMNA